MSAGSKAAAPGPAAKAVAKAKGAARKRVSAEVRLLCDLLHDKDVETHTVAEEVMKNRCKSLKFIVDELLKESPVAGKKLRLCNPWDIGQTVVRGPNWDLAGYKEIDGGRDDALGVTVPPSEQVLQKWLAIQLFGAEGYSKHRDSRTGWFLGGWWINRSICAQFASSAENGGHFFKADDESQYDLCVVEGMSHMLNVDRIMAIMKTKATVDSLFETWLPEKMANNPSLQVEASVIQELWRMTTVWTKKQVEEIIGMEVKQQVNAEIAGNRVLAARKSNPKEEPKMNGPKVSKTIEKTAYHGRR
ncbi:unnamed protein product [Prorocentrum cordatum]|uniref:Uncharacterized protein n=1 Tax=Prorocentrum cordatum TaxID=2364126 RepID=A0ABN9U5P7_9DINO|nr:unnamed protein product [Polarella glacialis]